MSEVIIDGPKRACRRPIGLLTHHIPNQAIEVFDAAPHGRDVITAGYGHSRDQAIGLMQIHRAQDRIQHAKNFGVCAIAALRQTPFTPGLAAR